MQNEEFDDDFENDINDSANAISENSKDFLKSCIDRFFADKIMHCGGKVPKYILTDPRKISMVSSTTLIDGVKIAYDSMKDSNFVELKKIGDITEDIKIVNETLNLLCKSGIPQKFAGGMMLIYLKYVKGIKINV